MKRIMIVDDSATSRMFIKRCLEVVLAEQDETEFMEAGDGKEALAKLKVSSADLVIIDLNMPIMDGATLLRWLKGSPKLTLIPVIVITSVDNPANSEELIKLGAVQVLSKPVAPAKLMPVINEVFDVQSDNFGF
ncbi:MAG: response regulator [Proteobacteria bacterium]|nr:response regulator [Pseudomonadota bacterium]